MDWNKTRIINGIDFDAEGRQLGELKLKHSSNDRSLGYYPLPVAVLKNGEGPTLLLTGGVHGDEYEGPAALLKLAHQLDVSRLRGRIIVFPALNMPAFAAAERCSPLDAMNLNRAFPGDRDGPPTAQIANLLEQVIMPDCDAAIDIHAGGRASEFVPLTMFYPGDDPLGRENARLAQAFAAPLMLIMGSRNDDRSVNGAALRAEIPMFATELGGGGWANPDWVALAEAGVYRVLHAMTMWASSPPAVSQPSSAVHLADTQSTVYAPMDGVFVADVKLGDDIACGQSLGTIFSAGEIERPPRTIEARVDGQLMCATRYGLVSRGDFLLQIGQHWP